MVGPDTNSRKRPIILSVNKDLVEKPRAAEISVPGLLEERPADAAVRQQRAAFRREAALIAKALNQIHGRYGAPIDEYLGR